MRLMSNDTLIVGMDFTQITHGEYLLNTFNNVIFAHVLTNVDDITFVLDKLSRDNPAFLLKWTEDALLYLKRHRRLLQEHVNDAVDVILRRFACLESAATGGNVGNHTEKLISIYGTAVRLMSKPTEIRQNSLYSELHNWIVQQLNENRDIEHKTQILRSFLVCLTDATDRIEDKRNLCYLYTLKNDRQCLCPHLSNDMTVNSMKVVNCFETLLVLLSVTGSILVLDCVINFAAGAGKSLFSDKLKGHLSRYYRRSDTDAKRVSLETTYQRFMRDADVKERLDVLQEFLLPAFDHCDAPTIESFFESKIHELRATVQKDVASIDNTNAQSFHLVSKIGCYQLLAIMCTRLSKLDDASNAIVRNASLDQTDKNLLQSLIVHAMAVRKLKIPRPECREIMRLLHCSAYNFTLAIVSLKEEEAFYNIAFGEKRDQLIWQNIVDCDKRYQLSQTFFKYPDNYQTTVNIKSSEVDGRGETSNQRRYIHSYDLSSCSLNEDINAYDLNKYVLLPAINSQWSATMSVTLEKDDFNEHECMPSICGILRRFSGLLTVSGLPKWLNYFVWSMRKNVHRNIRLFMLKIISNTADAAFKPYAKFILPGIAQAVASYLETDDLNYIITDVLEILIAWRNDISDESIGSEEIRSLFEVLADKVLVRRQAGSKRVYNYNLELIHTIAKKWRLTESIARLISKMSQDATIDLVVRLLRDNDEMAREIVDRHLTGDIVDFLLARLRDWNAAEEDVGPCCECLGWYLKLQVTRHSTVVKFVEYQSSLCD